MDLNIDYESYHPRIVKVFINGNIVNENDAKINANDHGVLFGNGLFETLRTVNQSLLFYDEHW